MAKALTHLPVEKNGTYVQVGIFYQSISMQMHRLNHRRGSTGETHFSILPQASLHPY